MEARMKGNLIWSCDVHATMKADSLLDLLENFIKCALGRTRLVSMRMEEWTHKLSFSGHPEVPWEHPPPWLLQSAGLSPQGISVWCLLMPTLWCWLQLYLCGAGPGKIGGERGPEQVWQRNTGIQGCETGVSRHQSHFLVARQWWKQSWRWNGARRC